MRVEFKVSVDFPEETDEERGIIIKPHNTDFYIKDFRALHNFMESMNYSNFSRMTIEIVNLLEKNEGDCYEQKTRPAYSRRS